VRRRFGTAVHHIRRISFDHADRGLGAGGKLAGTAHLATGDVHLNASSALADVLELHRWEFAPARSMSTPTRKVAFSALEATMAHELWHNMEVQLETQRRQDSMELRRQLGSYFGVETLEHAVEGRGPAAPPDRQRARALLMHEVSPYAGTNVVEATAELFRLWWCTRDAPSRVARHFDQAMNRFFPAPEP
jgi:hypothetical protein